MARLRTRPAVVDGILAVVLSLLVLWEIADSDVSGDPAVLVPLSLAATVPLAWRRTRTFPAVVAALVAFALLGVLDRSGQEVQTLLVSLLLASFSVGAHAARREARIGLALALGAALIDEPGDMIVMGWVIAGAWFAGRLVRAREEDARRLRELAAALERERVEQARLAVAEERTRIARELHDVVAHAMTTIVLEAGGERVNLPEGQDGTERALRSIERTGRQALGEMRRLVGLLRDDANEPALAPRPSLDHLDDFVGGVREAGVAVDVAVEGERVALSPGLDMSAFRIVQEALTNVMKHAGPARASVRLVYGERFLEIEIADDGRGGTVNGHGHGIAGMRERVAMFGGSLAAGGRDDGGGFVVRARLPVERPA